MAHSHITFFSEGIHFRLPDEKGTTEWILAVLKGEGKSPEEINYIFCDDAYLLTLNQDYLGHDSYTDIITFDLRETADENISADIFVSIERVKDNASLLGEDWQRELHRVLIHGILHLLGHNDHTDAEKIMMRQKEDECLKQLNIKNIQE